MSQNSKSSIVGSLVALLLGLVIAKGVWSIIAFLYLPKKGIDAKEEYSLKPLYYHYNLASKKEVIKPIVHKQAPKKVVLPKVIKKKIVPEKIDSFLFKGLYDSREKKLIVIEYQGKTYVLSIGEVLEGYKFTSLKGNTAIFTKNGKRYPLEIFAKKEKKRKAKQGASQATPSASKIRVQQSRSQKGQNQSQAAALAIRKEGETTIIPKDLFDRYRTNLRQIQKYANAVPHMVNGHLEGFRVNYIKKGSDFSKLGIQKGDIITAVNGEPLDNLKVAIEFFRNLNTMTAATFTIKRGNEIKELEYEVR